MNSLVALAVSLVAVSLAGCGGGGEAAATPEAPPASGTYTWVLKGQGPTDALAYGLSLVHPDLPEVEWVIEAPTEYVTDAAIVAGGSVDAAARRASGLQPFALVYVVGGDVRRVPLGANGEAPAARVRSAQTTSACQFDLRAIDHATPENSRFIATTAGFDGLCGSADDGRAEVRLDAALGLVVTPLVGDAPLAALRDPATLAPRGWLYATQARLWSGATIALRDSADPIDRVVASTPDSVLVESDGGLSLIGFSGAVDVQETAVAGVTATGWQAIGFDADSFYVYRNTAASPAGDWSVLRISRVLASATLLGSGVGQVASANQGTEVLFASVLGTTQNTLYRINKLLPALPQVQESGTTSTLLQVTTSGGGVHQLWRVTGLGGTAEYTLAMIDESGIERYRTTNGGWPLAIAEESEIDFETSENRNRFVFADGFDTTYGFSGAALMAYDAAAAQATPLGILPGSETFGEAYVFASALAPGGSIGGGFAAASSGGVLQASGARVFSFDPGVASSLRLASKTQ